MHKPDLQLSGPVSPISTAECWSSAAAAEKNFLFKKVSLKMQKYSHKQALVLQKL